MLGSGVDAANLVELNTTALLPWFTAEVVLATQAAAGKVLAQAGSTVGISISVLGMSYRATAWTGAFEDMDAYSQWYGVVDAAKSSSTMSVEVTAGIAVGGGCFFVFLLAGLTFFAKREPHAQDAKGASDIHVFGAQRFGGSSSSMHYHPADNSEEAIMESKKLFGKLGKKGSDGFGFSSTAVNRNDGDVDLDEYIAVHDGANEQQRRRSSYFEKPGDRSSDAADGEEYIAINGERIWESDTARLQRRASYLSTGNLGGGDAEMDEYIAINDAETPLAKARRRSSYLALGTPAGAENDKGPLGGRRASGWSISDLLRGAIDGSGGGDGGQQNNISTTTLTESNHYVEADEAMVSAMGGKASRKASASSKKGAKGKRPLSWDMSPLVLRWGGEVDLDEELAKAGHEPSTLGESDGVGRLLSDKAPKRWFSGTRLGADGGQGSEDDGSGRDSSSDEDDFGNAKLNRTYSNPAFGVRSVSPGSLAASTMQSHHSGLSNSMYTSSETAGDALSNHWSASDHWGNQLTHLDGWAETNDALTFLFDVAGSNGMPTMPTMPAPPSNGLPTHAEVAAIRSNSAAGGGGGGGTNAPVARVYASTSAAASSAGTESTAAAPRVYSSTLASTRAPISMTLFDGRTSGGGDDANDDDAQPGTFEQTYGNPNASELLITSGAAAGGNFISVGGFEEPMVHVAAGAATTASSAINPRHSPPLQAMAASVPGRISPALSAKSSDIQGLLDAHIAASERLITSSLNGGKLLKDLDVQEVGMLVEHALKGELGRECRRIFQDSYVSGALLETYGISDLMEIENSNGQRLHRPMARQLKIHIDAFRNNGVPASILIEAAGYSVGGNAVRSGDSGSGNDGRQGRAGFNGYDTSSSGGSDGSLVF